jgi:sec-independent protein translocase protein TatA
MPFHPLWLVVALIIVLIIFGPGRLPELGSTAGKAMREFRKATSDLTNEVTTAAQARPEPATPPAPAAAPESTAKGSTSEANSQKS